MQIRRRAAAELGATGGNSESAPLFADHRDDAGRASISISIPPELEIIMKRLLCLSLWALMFAASAASAAFHLFQIEQIFSNADGTVQFVVLHEFTGSNGENFW